MTPTLPATGESSPARWRIHRFVLRMLDSRRAELCICAIDPEFLAEDEATDDARRLAPLSVDDVEAMALAAEAASLAWTAVIPIHTLPAGTRDALRSAVEIFETDELDCSAGEELERLLLDLRSTTWTPQPLRVSLH